MRINERRSQSVDDFNYLALHLLELTGCQAPSETEIVYVEQALLAIAAALAFLYELRDETRPKRRSRPSALDGAL